MTRPGPRRMVGGVITVLIILAIVAVSVSLTRGYQVKTGAGQSAAGSSAGSAPGQPPVRVCSDRRLLAGPPKAPAHAVTVPAGDNSRLFRYQLPANITYYFAAGTHTLGSGMYSQITPGKNDTFIGAPGAIISGQMKNNYAFGPVAGNIKVEHLTIQHFTPPGNQGAVTASNGWTIAYDTVRDNVPGTGIYAGSNTVIRYDCLTENGQQGFAAYTATNTSRLTGGAYDVVITHNEISRNNTCNWESITHFPIRPPPGCASQVKGTGCGCSGGGKFWATDNATFTYNYVHDNYSVGMWADTNNTGLEIERNYFSSNLSEALIYEISYNAVIRQNMFIHNALGTGPYDPGFPDGAVYISQSGGDPRVPGRYSGKFLISNNVFINNWSGVVLWENSNRYCTSSANTSTGICTLGAPGTANLRSCGDAHLLIRQPYLSDCRWKTMNVQVTHNIFRYAPSMVSALCSTDRWCGFNGIFAIYGTYPPYTAWKVPLAISDHQRNSFAHNTYYGPWHFVSFSQGNAIDWSQWTHGFIFGAGADEHIDGQDAGSTIHRSA